MSKRKYYAIEIHGELGEDRTASAFRFDTDRKRSLWLAAKPEQRRSVLYDSSIMRDARALLRASSHYWMHRAPDDAGDYDVLMPVPK